ncbi:N-formylglutamate amidohydrolase [Aestuariivita boseongensis]|uniref:N-formylglutamate amidohydrolase n=1 Tax=Aestuariivita boseongensis TaxID=1470562 RepID=UPI0006821074|nr:N-formylglutamate amidohydrolase [Aestuariivita boseongensis]
MNNSAYALLKPEQRRSCVVFASPHSGRRYLPGFLERTVLDELTLRSSEDAFVDQLFSCVPEFGAPLLTAEVPRAYVDLNRSPDELDPALIQGVRRSGHNPRIASGLGVIPRVVSNGRAIYSGKLSRTEADTRIERYWHPYHDALQALLNEAHRSFGQAVLIDCHSMPHEAVDGVSRGCAQRPQIVLGDRFGAAASAEIVDQVEAAFASAGLVVTRNAPFAGAYITQAYGRPSRGQHAIQIEIDRALYMDEKRVEPSADFEAFRDVLRGVIAEIAGLQSRDMPLAAE